MFQAIGTQDFRVFYAQTGMGAFYAVKVKHFSQFTHALSIQLVKIVIGMCNQADSTSPTHCWQHKVVSGIVWNAWRLPQDLLFLVGLQRRDIEHMSAHNITFYMGYACGYGLCRSVALEQL